MKKKLLLGLLCAVLIISAGILFMAGRSLSISTGPCIAADNGSYMIIMDNSPVVLRPRFDGDNPFADLTTGDEILILHDGIQETYPGGTGLYYLRKLSDGEPDEVSGQVMEQLREMGWVIG